MDNLKKLNDGFKKSEAQLKKLKQDPGLLKIKTANEWIEDAKNCPIPNMLFGELWYEGELCILFADTNRGKSILAVQIADAISRGIPIKGIFHDAKKQKVIYLDFELSMKQFERRYSANFKDHLKFNDNLFRVEINPDSEIPKGMTFEDYLNYSIEKAVDSIGAKIIIIDNLTYLSDQLEKSKNALPIMKKLRSLIKAKGLSILTLAHTPKRDQSKPINLTDLKGSSSIALSIDSAFAIGKIASDPDKRYLKQLKQRNTEEIYGEDNVIVFTIKKDHNYLKFVHEGYGNEIQFLKRLSQEELDALEQSIIQLKVETPALSNRKISEKLGTNHTKVGRVLKKNQDLIKSMLENKNGTNGTDGTDYKTVPVVPKTSSKKKKS